MPRRAKSAVIETPQSTPIAVTARNDGPAPAQQLQPSHEVNDVHLVGRLAAPCIRRTLPSGDDVVTFRIIVDRLPLGVTVRPADDDTVGAEVVAEVGAEAGAEVAGADGMKHAMPEGPTRRVVDSLPCSAWTPELQLLAEELHPGDVVAVRGSLRRRFRRGAAGVTSLFEVAVTSLHSVAAPERVRESVA